VIECPVEILETRREIAGTPTRISHFGNGLSAGVFPGGSAVRPTLSTIEIIE
jgi:hypothetical protein